MKSVLALIFLFSLSAFAQTTSKHVPDERHFPLVQVNVSGSTRYTPQVITSSLGLRVGQQTSQKELEAASQKLANSGLFSLVQFRFGWAGNGVVANFDLSDNPNLVPVDFENFVWFTSSELAGALRKKLPLFTGVVPLSGDLRDQVQNELQQLLRDKNISGTVTAIPHGALNRPVEAMFFRVDGHDIKITSCDFQGADHANTIALGEIAKYITNLEYEKTAVASTIQARLKNLYDNLGYLSALVNDPVTTVVSTTPDHTELSSVTRVIEGPVYTVTALKFSGNTIYSPDDLTKAIKFVLGEPAKMGAFRDRLIGLHTLYGRHGYLAAKFEITPVLESNATAELNVNVREGKQYRVGTIQFSGINPLSVGQILSTWNLKPGTVYDDNYFRKFMAIDFVKWAPRGSRWEWTTHEALHDDTSTVDVMVDVNFKPGSAHP